VLLLCAALAAAIPASEVAVARRGGDRFMAELVARSFFRALLAGDVKALLPLCAKRVNLDGRWVEQPRLSAELLRLTERARSTALKLRRVKLVSYAEMVKRHGPPPKRLAGAVSRRDMIALARFNRLGALAVLTKQGRFWRVAMLSD